MFRPDLEGWPPTHAARHTHAQRARYWRDRGEDIGAVAGQPVGHEAPVGHTSDERMPGGNAVVVLQLARQPNQEPDVVDMVAVRRRRPPAIGPALVITVGVDH